VKNQDFSLLNRIIIGPGYPLRGGISESNQALNNYFQAIGQKSKIVSYSLQYPRIFFPGKNQSIERRSTQHNHNTINLINTLNPFSWIKTFNWVLKKKPDYVIVRYWHPYFAFCLGVIARMLRKRSIFIIAWIDNVYPHEHMPFQKKLLNFFLNSCHAFMVMSNSVKEQLIKTGSIQGRKIQISPHPIYNIFGNMVEKNIARKRIGISEKDIRNNEKYILFFGLIRPYKGLDLLLDVMASDKINRMGVKLIIAGEFYESKSTYVKKIHSLNIQNRVMIHDYYIPNEDVKNYFCASDIVVQPYRSASQSGVSMVAINFNKPMLLTNVGGLSEYVAHNIDGYLVNPDVDSIVLALQDYYNNNREEAFSKMLERKKTLYSWQELANKFDNIYKEIKYV
tara:strand:- start:75 stop:1259 length:1185 start_codon:yes stop_codon:yes gene_type:complete